MKLHHIALAAMAAATFATQAHAVVFNGATTAGGNVATEYTIGSDLSFDLDLASKAPVTLSFTLESSDFSGDLVTFGAIVRNLTGLGFGNVSVTLSGITFASTAGTISTDGFSAVSASGNTSTSAWASFTPGLTSEFYIGNPLGTPGQANWALNLDGLHAGNQFTVTVAVPEAETYALAVAGLAVVGLGLRRRKAA
jgi:hypothetical protein